MAQAREPGPVIFLTGILAAKEDYLDSVRQHLERIWGPVLEESPVFPFAHTKYYAQESGGEMVRRFYAFAGSFLREQLAGRKIESNQAERDLAAQLDTALPRPINIDPGYLAPEKLVLASCKNFAHRIYIGMGVFAEPTLLYRDKRFEPLPWTFPDFATGRYFPFLTAVRTRLMRDWYSNHV